MRGPRDMKYPTVAEVVAADQEQISFWWLFLQEPETPAEERVLDLIFKKYYANGGLVVPEISERSGRSAENRRRTKAIRR
jgi:hypothetical protein